MRALTKEIVNTDDDLTWKAIAVTVWLVVVACPIHFTFGEQPSVLAEDSSVVISLHEGPDDLDAPILRKLVHIRCEELPLSKLVAQLAELVGVPIILNRQAMDDAGLLSDEPITFSTEQPGMRQRVAELISKKTPIESWDANVVMRLDQTLEFILQYLDMTWVVENGRLHLTTVADARKHHIIDRSYSLTPFRKQKIEDHSLQRALSLEPGCLFHGWARRDELVKVGHILTIREAYPNQRKLRSLLQAIANPAEEQSGHYSAEEAACRHQFERSVETDFLDTPLHEAIDILAYQSKGRIFLDGIAVEESGRSIDRPVTFSMKRHTLRETLDIMLPELDLAVTIKTGELYVTTPEVAREIRKSRVYDLRSVAKTKELRDSLVQAIMSLTSEQWEETDKGGDLTMLENGVLVAVTNSATHNEIAKLVDFYRRHLSVPNR